MAIRKGYVDTDLGQVHYLASGDGVPLVLLHQTSDAATMWENVLPLFARAGYRAVAVDIPGHGQSDPPPSQPDGPEFARRVDEVTRLLGMERYAVLGHHFGATVALWMAADYPDRVTHLLFYGFPQIPEQNDHFDFINRQYMSNAKPRTYDREGNEVLGAWIARWDMSEMLAEPGDRLAYTSDIARRTLIARLQVGPEWYYAYHVIGRTDEVEVAKRVTAPTLVICGNRDHFWEDNRTTGAGLFADGHFAPMLGAGVDVADEYPEEFVEIVTGFIRSD